MSTIQTSTPTVSTGNHNHNHNINTHNNNYNNVHVNNLQQQQQQQPKEHKQQPLVKINKLHHTAIQIYIDQPLRTRSPTPAEQQIIDNEEYYLTGGRKRKLVEWYLDYIESSTDKFLISEANFNFSVIPVMYLDTPPSSMTEIEKNLVTVRRFLDDLEVRTANNNSNNNNNVNGTPLQHTTKIYRSLVKPVKTVVQEGIDQARAEFEVILWHRLAKLGLACRSHYKSSKLFTKDAKHRLDAAVQRSLGTANVVPAAKQMKEIIGDLQHLDMMEHYDNEFFSMDHGSKSADDPIVGVLGLIVNRLHRLENELKTIHQHWGHTSNNSNKLLSPPTMGHR
ncbi:hypothetical protein SAMD00019534_028240 [Acytostelium subglobosum LB1]|uniref:hypothetical protein n=1 Tax=Acytostelium subglobosum LB1 TaxID=1410327 RepID=UPI000644EEA0|nr:hypothetical protein SAMD00019534_028240 [Acytostelium subglobosum LB1]GAM19649.1 hypothetical protein SAMD00019534_028240 [Acytostelium subglobosum LB1]|eukprot:XP_012756411.1 hypothetical protein SAMD00019534_028240 [Acytostelium subglobosum LB1]